MAKGDEFWQAKLSVFKELVHHHVEEEESNIFTDARNELTEEKLNAIYTQFETEKQTAKEKLATPVGTM